MTKLSFIFLAGLYIAISIMSFSTSVSSEIQIIICASLIIAVGIPHGAIDNILFLNKSETNPITFYISYLLAIILYLGLWFLFPVFSLLLFLGISAYHFGESQFAEFFKNKSFKRATTYMAWGTNILSSLIYFNQSELINLFNSDIDLIQFIKVFNPSIHLLLIIASSVFLLVTGLQAIKKRNLSVEQLFKEMYILALIHIAFILLPLLPGFTLYFVVLHSAKVLIEEYLFLKQETKNMSLKLFLLKLLPYSTVSILGGAILFTSIYLGMLNISYILLSIILISVITLPHAFVMERFYTNNSA